MGGDVNGRSVSENSTELPEEEKITQPSARLNAKEDKTEHAGKVVRAKERIHSKVEKKIFIKSDR